MGDVASMQLHAVAACHAGRATAGGSSVDIHTRDWQQGTCGGGGGVGGQMG